MVPKGSQHLVLQIMTSSELVRCVPRFFVCVNRSFAQKKQQPPGHWNKKRPSSSNEQPPPHMSQPPAPPKGIVQLLFLINGPALRMWLRFQQVPQLCLVCLFSADAASFPPPSQGGAQASKKPKTDKDKKDVKERCV